MTSVQALRTQQYCLKWNNHNKNVSNVFDRLRTCEQFVDVTLFTSDRKSIKCHKILLSAGSGYLEEILEDNPSDHPTIVLSQILFEDLKLLIDFMYAGEVSVEQSRLVRLLDAAKILKIKGLYETAPFEDENMEASSENNTSGTTESLPSTKPSSNNNAIVVETQKRKRSTSSTDSVTHLPPSPKSPKPATAVNPLYGVTNAYFVTDANMGTLRPKPNIPPGTLPMLINKNDLGHEDSSPSPPPAAAQPATTKVNEESIKLQKMNQIIATGQIRRYKQYTEETLQQALKEIMDGQSINRSSVKYNIPARTLRDWMKRLNIKSVFTHNNNQTPGGNNNNNNITSDSKEDEEVKSDGPDDGTEHEDEDDDDSAPRLCSPQLKIISEDMKKEIPEDEEMEEEIDDDEEEKLKIDEEM